MQHAIAALLTAKEQAGLRPRYLHSLRQYLSRFACWVGHRPLACLRTDDIDAWFSSRAESPTTRASNLGRLRSLFRFALRRGWVASNPCNGVERVRIDRRPPTILSVDECRRLLNLVVLHRLRLLPYIAVCLFAGLRPSCAQQLNWHDIDWPARRIRISAQIAKTRRARFVPLEDTTIAWLRYCEAREGRLYPGSFSSLRRDRREAARRAGVLLTQDVLRHTCASYWLAKVQDAGKVAHWLGHTPAILLLHYRELVTPEEAERFWNLRP